MNHIGRSHAANRLLLFVLILALVSTASAEWKEKVLYSFQGGANDGATPAGGVVFDSSGNLYGATTQGGGDDCPIDQCGTVFELTPPQSKGGSWTETVLHIFTGNGSGDGNTPAGSVILDSAGNVYGTTAYGGNGNCVLLGTKAGCGAVFELSPPKQKGGQWIETLLYNFQGGNDGYFPNGNLVFDKAGNLYGATMFGGGKGTSCNPYYQYCGTVFELSPPKRKGGKWAEKVLHSFAGIESGKPTGDGANPNGGLVLDDKGAIYGTTYMGGLNCPHSSEQGCGTVFRLERPEKGGSGWGETQLHRFNRYSSDGGYPRAGVLIYEGSHLCGTTLSGGSGGSGTVFCLAPPSGGSATWALTILYAFPGNNEYGGDPVGGLTEDAAGKLYGTTSADGTYFGGTAFELKPSRGDKWEIFLLYSFEGSPDARFPAADLIFDGSGNLYSTSQAGGNGQSCQSGCGTVFEVSP